MAAAEFWDRIAEKYAARPVADEAAYADTLDRVRAHLTGDERALEIGCGTGTTALKLAPFLAEITATDISAEMIRIAEEKRGDAANVAFAVADCTDDDLPGGPFDVVFAFNFFHLADDAEAALSAAARRLGPGGLLISKTGLLGDAPFYLRPAIAVMRLFGKAPPVLNLRGGAWEATIRAAGFEIVDAKTYSGIAPTQLVIARKAT